MPLNVALGSRLIGRWRFALLLILASAAALAAPGAARAGGGPENVAVVVNADSWASKAVANEFIYLRKIPPCNVVYLHGLPGFEVIGIDDFRNTILKPVLETLEQRKLARQIDYVVYSSDIPYAVDVSPEASHENLAKSLPAGYVKVLTPTASVNGLTYLYALVLAKNVQYMSLGNNLYAKRDAIGGPEEHGPKAMGFSNSFGWSRTGQRVGPENGMRYMLSTMLAVTSGRGMSVRESIDNLRRSAAADGTHPEGTIYYMRNGDVRSTTREPLFAAAVERLKALGVKAEIVSGALPEKKDDVAGAMIGIADFNWHASGSKILPGAILEHLTSFGGIMVENSGQTPLTEFLRNGAAGASGTVTEPFAIQAKFPTAFIQAFYVEGCSLAEAFYQSVTGPYQLLIVGDPLCRPWAKIPEVKIRCESSDGNVAAGGTVKGKITLTPSLIQQDMPVQVYLMFVDGLLTAGCRPDGNIALDTAALGDGYHEVRFEAVGPEPIQTRGLAVFSLQVANKGLKLALATPEGADVTWPLPATISAELKDARKIEFLHNSQIVATIEGPKGLAKIDSQTLGQGRARVPRAVLDGNDGPLSFVTGDPIDLDIRPPVPAEAIPTPVAKLAAGVLLTVGGDRIVATSYTPDWLVKGGVRKGQNFTIEGFFQAAEDDVYQFQLKTNLEATIKVDSKPLGIVKTGAWQFLPISLAKGTHRLTIAADGIDKPELELRFGGPGARNVLGQFQHLPVAGERPLVKPEPKPEPKPLSQPATKPVSQPGS